MVQINKYQFAFYLIWIFFSLMILGFLVAYQIKQADPNATAPTVLNGTEAVSSYNSIRGAITSDLA